MFVKHSTAASPATTDSERQKLIEKVSEEELARTVREIAIPRHTERNAGNNQKIAELIKSRLSSFGYETYFQGPHKNVVALFPGTKPSGLLLVGAHYDSVPDCPGADDNASAVAALLVTARLLAEFAPGVPVCFVAFNGEEDWLVGSTDFVNHHLPESGLQFDEVHILEMIGYATDEPGSQKMPPRLPVKIPATGNFLGVLGNSDSNDLIDGLLTLGKSYLPELPALGLKIYLGAEKLMPDFGRSDHRPFWNKNIPALMWTDTADFRNPNYHQSTDLPETLNYAFLKRVTQLLLLQILSRFTELKDGL